MFDFMARRVLRQERRRQKAVGRAGPKPSMSGAC